MDIFLAILSILLAIFGIIGSIFPSLPGPAITYLGVVTLYFINGENISGKFLIYLTLIMLAVQFLSAIVPIAAAKLTGASKYGIIGSIIGAMLGLIIFPGYGFFAGTVSGAIIGELFVLKDMQKATRAGWGTIIGTLISISLQITFSVVFFVYILIKIIF